MFSAIHFSAARSQASLVRLLALVGSLPVPVNGMPRIVAASSSSCHRSDSYWFMVPAGAPPVDGLPGPGQLAGM